MKLGQRRNQRARNVFANIGTKARAAVGNVFQPLIGRAYAPAMVENDVPLLDLPQQKDRDIRAAVKNFQFTPQGERQLRSTPIYYPIRDQGQGDAAHFQPNPMPNQGNKPFIVIQPDYRTPKRGKPNFYQQGVLPHEFAHSIDPRLGVLPQYRQPALLAALQNPTVQRHWQQRSQDWSYIDQSPRGQANSLTEAFADLPVTLPTSDIPEPLQAEYRNYFTPGHLLQQMINRYRVEHQKRSKLYGQATRFNQAYRQLSGRFGRPLPEDYDY